MARGSKSASARPDVAHQSRFDALQFDPGESSDDEPAPPPPAATLSPATPATPSKKALARQRAKLRKQSSQTGLNSDAATDSDASNFHPAHAAVPPVPSLLPSQQAVSDTLNGVKDQVRDKAEQVREAVVKSAAPVVEAVAPAAPAEQARPATETPRIVAHPPAPESVSSDDDDQAGVYTDDEEDDEDDAPATVTTAPTSPYANSPRPASPSPHVTSAAGASAAGEANGAGKPKEAYTGADHDPKKKIKAIMQRTVWGVVMAGGAIGLVCMGHVYVIALVFIVQAVVFKELTALFDAGYSGAHVSEEGKLVRTPEKEAKRKERKEERERWSRRMAWYFFAVANYFLYGESLNYYFKHIMTLQASFLPTAYSFAQHHRLISFGLYVIGFVSFVATLNRSSLRRQFGLFGWIHMSLLLIVVSSHFIVDNILEGMIWFWVPASLVIINDVAAYVCGMLFGRHMLIKLSPKKTVEGFVGAFFVTMAFAYIWGTVFMRYNYMICPVQDLSMSVFTKNECTPNNAFVWRELPVPASVSTMLEPLIRRRLASIPWAPFQLHSVVMATFASLVAPFGGFFASGFKRAFGIKDFGNSIPGHGGMTDRMDCQFLMGLFTYVYHASLIRETHVTPASLLALALTHLTTEQQLELVGELSKVLAQKGVRAVKPW
ncbi:hypothetical protein Rhopal_006648-T1 [Rhodotorula paludigena]|uniref:Phosphatidate cytidylyltransferase n=1 Tax=Rhodotorula paludigena TaxID=86838 RepID=A0AAV5GMR5_9BASI|nr:hypothetical protein Rhopal_006648-T1 [Rhodotorula paludigena]